MQTMIFDILKPQWKNNNKQLFLKEASTRLRLVSHGQSK